MNPGNLSPCSVTPVGHLLARCVAKGVLSQDDLDAVSRSAVFPRLQEAQQHTTTQGNIDELKLQMELLTLEKDGADVTHEFYLSQLMVSLQRVSAHLQSVLAERAGLSQRLMKPLCQTNLPVQADLHSYVVDTIMMVGVSLEKLVKKVNIVRTIPKAEDSIHKLDNAVTQIMVQMGEVQMLYMTVIQLEYGSAPHSTSSSLKAQPERTSHSGYC